MYLCGHSSGAHVAAVAALDSTEAGERTRGQLKGVGLFNGMSPPQLWAGLEHYSESPRSCSSPHSCSLNLGVYNPEGHLRFEAARGVEEISTMAVACALHVPGRREEGASRLLHLPALKEVNDDGFRIYLAHGEDDATVPVTQSEAFAAVLRRREGSVVMDTVCGPAGGHGTVISDAMGLTACGSVFVSGMQQLLMPADQAMP